MTKRHGPGTQSKDQSIQIGRQGGHNAPTERNTEGTSKKKSGK